MALTPDDVRKIAYLARIKVPNEQLNALAGELNGIIDWVEQLSEVDTDGVEPMTSVTGTPPRPRGDEVSDAGYPERILRNAPDRVRDFYAVPKVVE